MKQILLFIALLAAAMLDADSREENADSILATHPEVASKFQGENDRIVVITDAEFVPFSQYLGLADINNLPSTSAGISRDEPKRSQPHTRQRAQHRAP
jgi:hypothetical protein